MFQPVEESMLHHRHDNMRNSHCHVLGLHLCLHSLLSHLENHAVCRMLRNEPEHLQALLRRLHPLHLRSCMRSVWPMLQCFQEVRIIRSSSCTHSPSPSLLNNFACIHFKYNSTIRKYT